MPANLTVVADQARARARIADLVDAAQWRDDHRARALAVLHALVDRIDRHSGVIIGATRAQLAEGADCSPRTVSRILAWATHPEIGLLTCLATGPPTYAVIDPSPPGRS